MIKELEELGERIEALIKNDPEAALEKAYELKIFSREKRYRVRTLSFMQFCQNEFLLMFHKNIDYFDNKKNLEEDYILFGDDLKIREKDGANNFLAYLYICQFLWKKYEKFSLKEPIIDLKHRLYDFIKTKINQSDEQKIKLYLSAIFGLARIFPEVFEILRLNKNENTILWKDIEDDINIEDINFEVWFDCFVEMNDFVRYKICYDFEYEFFLIELKNYFIKVHYENREKELELLSKLKLGEFFNSKMTNEDWVKMQELISIKKLEINESEEVYSKKNKPYRQIEKTTLERLVYFVELLEKKRAGETSLNFTQIKMKVAKKFGISVNTLPKFLGDRIKFLKEKKSIEDLTKEDVKFIWKYHKYIK